MIIIICNVEKVVILPFVIGALATVTGNVIDNLRINLSVDALQKTCLLGTACILRKVLDIQRIQGKKGNRRQKREDRIGMDKKEDSLSA